MKNDNLPEINKKRISFYFGHTSSIDDSGLGQSSASGQNSDYPTIQSSTLADPIGEPERRAPELEPIGEIELNEEEPQIETNPNEMNRTPSIRLELPTDPRLVEQKLRMFEVLAAKGAMTDDGMVVTLSQAIDASEFRERMAEVLEEAHLANYPTLKRALLETIKVDLDERYQLIFAPNKRNPLLAYNQLREKNLKKTEECKHG